MGAGEVVSLYAAAVGTASLSWQIFQWRANGRSKVTMALGYELQRAGSGNFYAPVIVVRNAGRAVAHLMSASFLLPPNSGAVSQNGGLTSLPATEPEGPIALQPQDECRFRAPREKWSPLMAGGRDLGALVLLGSGEELRMEPRSRPPLSL
jgi:hypothetical protein